MCAFRALDQAADISIVAEEAPNHPPAILIKGQFKNEEIQNDISTFSALSGYNKNPAVVFLDSPGGQVRTAIQIGLAIKRHGFSTAVADDTRCSSACALIWTSGKEKFMGKNARIGFHAPKADKPEASQSALAIVGAYLNEVGVKNFDAVKFLTDAPLNLWPG